MNTALPPDPLIGSKRARRQLVSVRAAAVAGVICAIGWSLALRGLLRTPNLDATDAEIATFYADTSNSTAILVWLQVLVVATIAFLWFVGVVRARIGEREPRLFGTVYFGSSILLAALLFVGAAVLAAPAILVSVGEQTPDPAAASLTRAAAVGILSVFGSRVATLVMFSTATLGRATGALPSWLVWTTYVIGVIELLNVSIAVPTVYVVPAWIGLVSVVLLIRDPTSMELPTEGAPEVR